jgi:uncharacterized protein DUF4082/Big-like domain-containing protein/purple acid phosphatase-like protein
MVPRIRAFAVVSALVLLFPIGLPARTASAAPVPARDPAAPAAAVPPPAGCPRTVWRDNEVPAATASTATSAYELGVRFRADRDGYVTGVRFYKGSGNGGTHIGRLWSGRGEKLAEATFTAESASGWQQVSFATPVRIAAGTTYVVSYYAPVGRYSYTYDYFATTGRVRPPLTALLNGADGANGVYRSGAGFPGSTYRSINYWVDPVFDPTSDDACPATIWTDTQTPAAAVASADPVELGVKFRASQAGYVQGIRFFKGPGNTGVHSGRLWSRTGTRLAEASFVAESAAGWQQAWFAQPVAISAGTTYVASYYAPAGHYGYTGGAFSTTAVTRGPLSALRDGTDGGNGVYAYGTGGGFPSSSYNATSYGVDVMFTTTSTFGAPGSVWPATGQPGTAATTDASAVEVGVRFRPLRSGYVKGVRFFKGAGNTGTHVGTLWSNAGTQLARATFSGESAGGWQQVLFGTPVAVSAGTTYVASYYAPAGHYAFDDGYFATENTMRGVLAALADGVGGADGVYRYGAGFPTATYHSGNYWVDVVYDSTTADTQPPRVVATSPTPGADAVAVRAGISARFSEGVVASSISVAVSTANGTIVSGSTAYDPLTATVGFTPGTALGYRTDYWATVSGARDGAGNVMSPYSWMFTTTIDPAGGPGGPIAVITGSANRYTTYYADILRTEGLDEFTVLPLESLTLNALQGIDVAVLGDLPLTDAQAALLTGWVNSGGRLIAMSPDPRLAGLLGLTATGGTLTNGYLAVDPATPAGAGITTTTVQFHGTADTYTPGAATTVARLYTSAGTATAYSAVTVRPVGGSGGWAAAFTYDLARSVALTRQGNPAWAGQERDGNPPIRSDDMFIGAGATDWVDLSRVAVPQADEQQRLLVNLIETLNADRKPLPRFWYFPDGRSAVVVATGDDEALGTSGTSGRFDRYLANSPAGCDPTGWQCLRFTSYVWPDVGLTDAQARAYDAQGFEVALHPQNGCVDFTPATLESSYATQLPAWTQKYPSLAAPVTARYHCIVYSDWDSQPKTEYAHGIRFDTNYYYWPGSWVQDRPGFMTGSGMPMRFTDRTGALIDVYQGATVLTDESGQSYPYTPNALLDNAIGPNGYGGVFVANMHDSNQPTSYDDDQLVASAQNHGVAVVTARDLLRWLDARNSSRFSGLAWNGTTATFTVAAARSARGLTALLPTTGVGGTTLVGLTRDGVAVPFDALTVKGIEYAWFAAPSGGYSATYALAASGTATAPSATTTATAATITWSTTVPGTAQIAYGTSPTALTTTVVAENARRHRVTVTGLVPGTRYYYRVTSQDRRGRATVSPGPDTLSTFTTAPADTRPPTVSAVEVTPLPDGTVRVGWRTDEPATSTVAYGMDALTRHTYDATPVTAHLVVLTGLDAERGYTLRVSSTDPAGNTGTAAAPTAFTTAPPGVADQTRVGFRTGTGTGTTVTGTGLAELSLAAGTPSGSFDSRTLDAFATVGWRIGRWDATVPSGARLAVSVRTGNTPRPDTTWSAWTPVPASGAMITVPPGRYLQYHLDLAAGAGVPVLRWIGFTHDGTLAGATRRATGTAG